MEYVQMILAICGGIGIIGSAGAVVFKIIRPAVNINSRVAELERRSQSDYKAIHSLIESNRTQNLALLAMVNHMIDGNGVDRLKETRDRMQRELMNG